MGKAKTNNMKKLLIILSLTFCYAMATGQNIYYGGSIGVVSGNYYSPKKQIEKKGVYDAYLHGLVGYTNSGFLVETEFGATASLIPSINLSGGVKGDFSDNVGFHFLIGCKDEMATQTKNFSVTHYFYPTARFRIWIGTFSIQSTFIAKKEIYGGNELEIGIGVIGF